MKNRRSVIIAFLLCASILVGVGYATVTDVLDITGSVDVTKEGAQEAFNHDVYFAESVTVGPTVVNGTSKDGAASGNTSSRNADNPDKVSFTVNSLQGKDDTATFTYTIVNAGDVDATVTPSISSNTNEEYFDISSSWNGQAQSLAAGTQIDYTITVTLKKTPEDVIAGSFIIELTATSDADVDAGV